MIVNFKKLRENAIIPTWGHDDDSNAGMDFYACLPENCDTVIMPNGSANITTGVAWEPPLFDPTITMFDAHNYDSEHWKPAMIIKGRSGLSIKHGLEECNAGVIDSGYRGEIMLRLYNHGNEPYTIHHGDRIAQGIVVMLPVVTIREVNTLGESTRGTNGFGSSGK